MSGQINLVAVQPELKLERYTSAAAFRRWVLELAEEGTASLPPAPTLIAFPELIGVPLLIALGASAAALRRPLTAISWWLRRHWRAILGSASLSLWRRLYGAAALPAYAAYREAFSAVSREFGATVVAGSIFVPRVDWEPAKGWHIADRRVYNTAFVFGPRGQLLGRSAKAHLTAGLESRVGLARGSASALPVFCTPLGRLGVAICLDGFYRGVIDHLDGQGAQLVVQPSANLAPWSRPWPPDPQLPEGEAWLRYGLRHQLQARQHLWYGVNPMLVGELWGLVAEGRSSIVANCGRYPAALEGYPGLIAIAPEPARAAVVRATLPAPV